MTDTPPGEGRQHHGNPPSKCVCPQCGYKADKSPAVPCWSMRCPKCETMMVGG